MHVPRAPFAEHEPKDDDDDEDEEEEEGGRGEEGEEEEPPLMTWKLSPLLEIPFPFQRMVRVLTGCPFH